MVKGDENSGDSVDPLDLYLEGKRTRLSRRGLTALVGKSLRLVWTISRRDFGHALFLQLLPATLAGVQILLARNVLSAVVRVDQRKSPSSALLIPCLWLGAVVIVVAACQLIYQQQQRVLFEVVQRGVWARILSVTSSVDLESFEDPDFFDQLDRVENNALTRPVQVTQSIVGLLGGAVGLIGLTVALITLQPLLLAFIVLAAIPLYIFTRRGAQTEFDFVIGQTPVHRERMAVQELLTSRDPAKELRAYELGAMLSARWAARYDTFVTALRRQVARRIRLTLVGNGLAGLAAAGSLVLVAAMVGTHHMSFADAAAAVLAMRQLSSRATQSLRSGGSLTESTLFLGDLEQFLERQPEPFHPEQLTTLRQPFRCLRLENVSFAYPSSGNTAVEHLSMEIQAGEVIAVVGENGSGKTTLAKLLAALYQPTGGRILWDDVNLNTVDAIELRRQIAVVFQDFVRYPLPASDNIGVGQAERLWDRAAIEAAAKQAGAHKFLSELPDGYDTYLSKLFRGGRDLSLGQWQRVMLARAFYRNAPFVILDEPTASLDPRAEFELFSSIRNLLVGRTVLLISHRFSTVRSADRIFVMDAGRLVEDGSHDQLMALGGLYNELFTIQANAYQSGPS